MASLVFNENCGCATTDEDWDALTDQFMKYFTEAFGYNPQIGNALNQIVMLARTGAGQTPVFKTNIRPWIVKIGNPTQLLSPFEKVNAEVFNGSSFTFPELEGYDISHVRVGRQPIDPVNDGYQWNQNDGQLDTADPLANTYLYFLVTQYNADAIGLGTFFYGTKPDASPLDQSDIESGTLIGYTEGMDVTAPFTPSGLGLRYWAAWKSTDTTMSSYYVNSLDYGTFANGNTFGTPYTVGPYTVVETAYETSLSDTTFKHS